MKFLSPDSPGTPHTLPKHSQDKLTKFSGLGSASVQSHPSSVVSRARLRNPGASSDSPVTESDLEANGLGLASWSFFRWQHGFPPLWPLESQYFGLRPGRYRYLKWFLVLYSFSSVVLFTTSWWNLAFGGSAPALDDGPRGEIDPLKESLLQNISSPNLLSKLTTVNPELKNLDPFVLNPRVDPDTVTACLWTQDSDLPLVHSWATRWTGAISLLVRTHISQDSPEYTNLLQNISTLRNSARLSKSLSVHVLQVEPHSSENPNAYLNLARLFSQTSRIAIFPGNLTYAAPKTFYKTFFSLPSPKSNFVSSGNKQITPGKPVLFTTRTHATYPFSGLSPIVFNRDDPVWCTERFFVNVSREADWGECMWQIWLEYFGDLDIKLTSEWVLPFPGVNGATYSSFPYKLHRRLGAKFRGESCMLATRRLAALKTTDKGGANAKKARWLKRYCREWMVLA